MTLKQNSEGKKNVVFFCGQYYMMFVRNIKQIDLWPTNCMF